MKENNEFKGFDKKTVVFLRSLKKNNNKTWFNQNRKIYDDHVLGAAKRFVVAMGERLREYSPQIHAVPRVNSSIFRISKDIRFSQDKSPYKTHMGLYFWEGARPRMECPGYYFHLEPPNIMLGVGIYMLSGQAMDVYRRAVVNPEKGEELTAITKKISKLSGYSLGGKHYKRIPPGYPKDHPNAEFLLYNGLYGGIEVPISEEFYSEKILDFCMQKYKPMVPLHKWLVSIRIGEYA